MKGNSLRLILVMVVGLIASGCASLGPMQSSHGLLKTNAFDPIFISTIDEEGGEGVMYRAVSSMFKGEPGMEFVPTDTLVITGQAIYLVRWDTMNYDFVHKVNIPISEVESVKVSAVDSFWSARSWGDLFVNSQSGDLFVFRVYDGSAEIAKKVIMDTLERKGS